MALDALPRPTIAAIHQHFINEKQEAKAAKDKLKAAAEEQRKAAAEKKIQAAAEKERQAAAAERERKDASAGTERKAAQNKTKTPESIPKKKKAADAATMYSKPYKAPVVPQSKKTSMPEQKSEQSPVSPGDPACNRIVKIDGLPAWVNRGQSCQSCFSFKPGKLYRMTRAGSTVLMEFFDSAGAASLLAYIKAGGTW